MNRLFIFDLYAIRFLIAASSPRIHDCLEIGLCYFERIGRGWREANKIETRAMECVSRQRFPCGLSMLKGIHLPPSDISHQLYCTSRPSWWSRRCPHRTNERPLKRNEKRRRRTLLTFAIEFLGRCPKARFVRWEEKVRFAFFSLARTCKFFPRRYNFVITSAKLYISLFTSGSDCDRSSIAILLEKTIERVVSHCDDHLS